MKTYPLPFMMVLLAMSMVFQGCAATLPDNTARLASQAYTNTAGTYFGRQIADELAAHPGKSGFVPLVSGLDAFVANEDGFEVWSNDGTAVFTLAQSFGGSNSVGDVFCCGQRKASQRLTRSRVRNSQRLRTVGGDPFACDEILNRFWFRYR